MRIRRAVVTMTVAALAAIGLSALASPAQAATPEYLFTVQAVKGSTSAGHAAKGEDERFTLTLQGVDPVTKFADRPFRSASVMSPAALVANWDAWFVGSAPNAVLTYTGAAGTAPNSIVVTLTRPRYDKVGRTLSFTATRTYRTLEPSQKGNGWNRPATPRAFTSASLFIDDAGSNATAGLVSQMQQALQPYVFSPNDMNTWSAAVQALSSILNVAWAQGTLVGATQSDAYTVVCAPTSDQILNGYMSCSVTMQLPGGTTYSTTLTQMMGTSG